MRIKCQLKTYVPVQIESSADLISAWSRNKTLPAIINELKTYTISV